MHVWLSLQNCSMYFIRDRMTDLHEVHGPLALLGILLIRADADSCFHLTEARVVTPSPLTLISISDHVILSMICVSAHFHIPSQGRWNNDKSRRHFHVHATF